MADWEEIKRLAADFQRTQTSDTLQKFSERNCIDVVRKLTELKLIELIYTCDGREFITPEHLAKEIEDEIHVNGGRMHIHDLATKLNVDYQHVDRITKNLPDDYQLILGQVIHSNYKNVLGKQIQDTMLLNGQLRIADFAKSIDLPSEFLLSLVKEILPTVIDDFVVSADERTYYTSDMMDRYKSIIAGTLSAITKPTTIASIMKRIDLPERIFAPIVDGLIKESRIDAVVESRLFIPAVYARKQSEYIDKFYSSNSYIEYDVLSRMDIKQPKTFLRKRFPDGLTLKSCFVSPDLVSQVESLIEDTIASNGWIDIGSVLPPSIEADDIEQMLENFLKEKKHLKSSFLIFNKTNVCSPGYITSCKESLSNLMPTKAQEHLKQGRLVSHFLGGKLKEPARKPEGAKQKDEEELKDQEGNDKDNSQATTTEASESLGVDKGVKETSPVQGDEDQIHTRDIKKDKKDRKNKVTDDFEDSDEDQGNRRSKGKKSGGGSQGREIKQRAVKKKYNPGNKGNQRGSDTFDDESAPSKTPRSNKGRAAKRAVSPERPREQPVSSAKPTSKEPRQRARTISEKEPLVFMSPDEIAQKLRNESRGSGDDSEEFFESIAGMIVDELNATYETIARETLDQFMRMQNEDDENDVANKADD